MLRPASLIPAIRELAWWTECFSTWNPCTPEMPFTNQPKPLIRSGPGSASYGLDGSHGNLGIHEALNVQPR